MNYKFRAIELNEEAYQLLTQGKFEKALEKLREAYKCDPVNKDVWYNMGSCFTELGKRREALDAYVHVLRIDARGEEAAKRLAITMEAESVEKNPELNQYLTAFECNEFAASQLKAFINAKGFGTEDILEGAIIFCNKAIELDPQFAEAYNNRGYAFKELGRYDDAFNDYDIALQIKPNYAIAWYNKGKCYLELIDEDSGPIGEALTCFEKSYELDHSNYEAKDMANVLRLKIKARKKRWWEFWR